MSMAPRKIATVMTLYNCYDEETDSDQTSSLATSDSGINEASQATIEV